MPHFHLLLADACVRVAVYLAVGLCALRRCGEQMCCPSGLPGLPAAGIADSGAYWSPLAGFGTPNYPGLLSAVLAAGETTRQYV